jgi:hypothetical protein
MNTRATAHEGKGKNIFLIDRMWEFCGNICNYLGNSEQNEQTKRPSVGKSCVLVENAMFRKERRER